MGEIAITCISTAADANENGNVDSDNGDYTYDSISVMSETGSAMGDGERVTHENFICMQDIENCTHNNDGNAHESADDVSGTGRVNSVIVEGVVKNRSCFRIGW